MASITTLSLFAFMAYLIHSDEVVAIHDDETYVIDFMEEPKPSSVKIKQLIKPEPPKIPPVMPKTTIEAEPKGSITGFAVTPSKISLSNKLDKLTFASSKDTDARPIVRVNPKYPAEAAQKGIEGWVRLVFDVNEVGAVINVKIVDALPKRIFNQAAKQAIKKWRYQAKSVNGKYIRQENLSIQLDFTMEQNS